jgi:hypothetical protein
MPAGANPVLRWRRRERARARRRAVGAFFDVVRRDAVARLRVTAIPRNFDTSAREPACAVRAPVYDRTLTIALLHFDT